MDGIPQLAIGWVYYVAIGALIAMFVAMMIYSSIKQPEDARRCHKQTHANVSDDDFLQAVGVGPEHAHIALGVRRVVAKSIGVPPETVHPDDTLKYISDFHFDGLDFLDLNFGFERVLDIRIPIKFWDEFYLAEGKPHGVADALQLTIADLARHLAKHWDEVSSGESNSVQEIAP